MHKKMFGLLSFFLPCQRKWSTYLPELFFVWVHRRQMSLGGGDVSSTQKKLSGLRLLVLILLAGAGSISLAVKLGTFRDINPGKNWISALVLDTQSLLLKWDSHRKKERKKERKISDSSVGNERATTWIYQRGSYCSVFSQSLPETKAVCFDYFSPLNFSGSSFNLISLK